MEIKINPDNAYTQMQKNTYARLSKLWSLTHRDPVVGTFDAHNNHADYEFLFSGIDTQQKVALDFGCGPGRNIVQYARRFKRIDGVDIDYKNLLNARAWAEHNGVNGFKLFLCNGIDLSIIKDAEYDFVLSTIVLQHICVHDIRQNYFKEFYRVLKPDGQLSFQMGFGSPSPSTVGYFENRYDAQVTNRGLDTEVSDPEHLKVDLEKVGFQMFEYDIRPTGPGDWHPNWIFVRVRKTSLPV